MTGSWESSLSSRMASKMRGKLGLDKFARGSGSKSGMDSSATSTGRRPSTKLELPKMGAAKGGGSFKEAHEYGMESLDRVSEAYEEPQSSRKNSKTSAPVLLDPESNMMGAGRMSLPLTPAYPGRLGATSPLRTPVSDDDTGTVGENLNFSFVTFNASDNSSNEDETHLMASKDDFAPISPTQLPRSSSRLSYSESLRAGGQLRSPSPALVSDRGPSVVAPWPEPSEQQFERTATERISEGSRPKPKRKLSKERGDGKKV